MLNFKQISHLRIIYLKNKLFKLKIRKDEKVVLIFLLSSWNNIMSYFILFFLESDLTPLPSPSGGCVKRVLKIKYTYNINSGLNL